MFDMKLLISIGVLLVSGVFFALAEEPSADVTVNVVRARTDGGKAWSRLCDKPIQRVARGSHERIPWLGASYLPSDVYKRLVAIYQMPQDKAVLALHRWQKELLDEPCPRSKAIYCNAMALHRWYGHECEREVDFVTEALAQKIVNGGMGQMPDLLKFFNLSLHTMKGVRPVEFMCLVDCLYGGELRDLRKSEGLTSQFATLPKGMYEERLSLMESPESDYRELLESPRPETPMNCRMALHDASALSDAWRDRGLVHWRYEWGKELPEAVRMAMEMMRERQDGRFPAADQLAHLENLSEKMEEPLRGFVPRCLLATAPSCAPWKKLDDPSASLFRMPDVSSVTLPQWSDAFFGHDSTLEDDLQALCGEIETAAREKRLGALVAFSLSEAELALPNGYLRAHLGVEGYDEFHEYIELSFLRDGVDIVMTPQGPRFSRDDRALTEQARRLNLALHRAMLKLACLERDGEREKVAEAVAKLAAVFNRYHLWPLLINQYELRGVSPAALYEFVRNFDDTPVLQRALVATFLGRRVGNVVLRLQGGKGTSSVLLALLDPAKPEKDRREAESRLVGEFGSFSPADVGSDAEKSSSPKIRELVCALRMLADEEKWRNFVEVAPSFRAERYNLICGDCMPMSARLALMEKFVRERRFASAAFLAEQAIHKACVSSTPGRELGSHADLVRLRVRADVCHALSFLRNGRPEDVRRTEALIADVLPLLRSLSMREEAQWLLDCAALPESLRPLIVEAMGLQSYRPALWREWGDEPCGVPQGRVGRFAQLQPGDYEWHLNADAKEVFRAGILAMEYNEINPDSETILRLRKKDGQVISVPLKDLPERDLEHVEQWFRLNDIRAWHDKNTVRMGSLKVVHGKLLERYRTVKYGVPHALRFGGGVDAEGLAIRSTNGDVVRMAVDVLPEEEAASLPQLGGISEEPLHTVPTWAEARAVAKADAVSPVAVLLGQAGGEAEQAWLALLRNAEWRSMLNREGVYVCCYTDEQGRWDDNARAASSQTGQPLRAGSLVGEWRGFEKSAVFYESPQEKAAAAEKSRFFALLRGGKAEEVRRWLQERPEAASMAAVNGGNALTTAIRCGSIEVVRALLDAGADPNDGGEPDRSSGGRGFVPPPLYVAASEGRRDIYALLESRGANHRQCEEQGFCPGIGAVVGLRGGAAMEMIDYVLSRGCHLEDRDYLGRTMLSTAVRAKKPFVVRELMKRGAKSDYLSTSAVSNQPEPIVFDFPQNLPENVLRALIEGGYDVNVTCTSSDRTLLSDAILNDDVEKVRFLLEHGADPQTKYQGVNMLMLASFRSSDALSDYEKRSPEKRREVTDKQIRIAGMLLEHGADINEVVSSLGTAWDYTQMHVHKGERVVYYSSPAFSSYLKQRGALPHPRKDKEGEGS